MKLIRAPFALILLLIGVAPSLALMATYYNFVEVRHISRQLGQSPPPRQGVQERLKNDRSHLLIFGSIKAGASLLAAILVVYLSRWALGRKDIEFLGLRLLVWASFMWIGAAFMLTTLIAALVHPIQ